MQSIYLVHEAAFRFGPFELVPVRRCLSKDGHAVRVGSRALDLLVALVENAGQVVEKGELMARVWPNVVVHEGNLRVHVAALRRLLGDDGLESRYIVHVARRGYIFVAPLISQDERRLARQEPIHSPAVSAP
jgi:DNA-binding winged helix-turn-helix (wHTH) protein